MSLDVYIKFKEPKRVNYNKTHSACGSTMMIVDDFHEEVVDHWSANVTHNMGGMASHIPVTYKGADGDLYESTLYQIVWRPEEINACNTDIVGDALDSGLRYMVTHRKDLLQYNPENGGGSYDAFLIWLTKYKQACDENPDCEIEVWR